MIDLTKVVLDLEDKTPRILKVDGTVVPFPPKNGRAFDYKEIQKAIEGDGNNDPCFTIAGSMGGMIMLAEDNAIAMQLRHNAKATWFYNEAARQLGHKISKGQEWPILGNCLLLPKEMME